MPLENSKSNAARNRNIAELINANKDKPKNKKRSLKQILAISYEVQRKAKGK